LAGDLPADGVVTGVGRVGGRDVAVMANDSTVKAGSWGARTVEKIIRIEEYALRHELPLVWLVDSAGARITDQVEMFPGRRGSGCGDLLAADEDEALAAARHWLSYFPSSWRSEPPSEEPRGPAYAGPVAPLVPLDEAQPFDMLPLVAAVCDEGSFFEVKREYAQELIC